MAQASSRAPALSVLGETSAVGLMMLLARLLLGDTLGQAVLFASVFASFWVLLILARSWWSRRRSVDRATG